MSGMIRNKALQGWSPKQGLEVAENTCVKIRNYKARDVVHSTRSVIFCVYLLCVKDLRVRTTLKFLPFILETRLHPLRTSMIRWVVFFCIKLILVASNVTLKGLSAACIMTKFQPIQENRHIHSSLPTKMLKIKKEVGWSPRMQNLLPQDFVKINDCMAKSHHAP